MGQYHTLICPEAATYVNARDIDSGMKAVELVGSEALAGLLAYLLSAERGEHPRDLPWAPKGDWAGKMPLLVGDYAKAGDIRNPAFALRTPENEAYDHCSDRDQMLGMKPARRKRLDNIAHALLPIDERVFGRRSNAVNADGHEIDVGYATFFPVRFEEPHGWHLDLTDIPEAQRLQVGQYYERMGAKQNTGWQRAPISNFAECFKPLSDVPDIIPSSAEGIGDKMLWVNLDRLEYIDPEAFGDTPDLVGVMKGDSGRAVLAMLLHHEQRGGGDLGDLGPLDITGRWRGDRLVLMGAAGFKGLHHEKVRSDYLDITGNAKAFTRLETWFGHDSFDETGAPRTLPGASQTRALRAAYRDPAVLELLRTPESAGEVKIRIIPRMTLKDGLLGCGPDAPVDIAPSLEVYGPGDGKIRLSSKTCAEIHAALSGEQAQVVRTKTEGRGISIDCSAIFIRDGMTTHHEVLSAMAA